MQEQVRRAILQQRRARLHAIAPRPISPAPASALRIGPVARPCPARGRGVATYLRSHARPLGRQTPLSEFISSACRLPQPLRPWKAAAHDVESMRVEAHRPKHLQCCFPNAHVVARQVQCRSQQRDGQERIHPHCAFCRRAQALERQSVLWAGQQPPAQASNGRVAQPLRVGRGRAGPARHQEPGGSTSSV